MANEDSDTVKYVGSLVRRFNVKEVLNEDTSTKTIWLLGTIDGSTDDVIPGQNAGIITLERLAFPSHNINDSKTADNVNSPLLSSIVLSSAENNDIYSWANGFVKDELFLPDIRVALIYPAQEKHINKYRKQDKIWVRETPALYSQITQPYIIAEPLSRIQWVYNILSKETEAERIIFEDPDPQNGFIVLPDLKWDCVTKDSMYLVAIVHRRDLKSLRNLTSEHLPLLKNIREKAAVAARKYNVLENQLRLYLHYQPSYYHLHVHITHVNFDGKGMMIGRAHSLDSVIDNIENIASDYYQKATLSYELGSNSDLWPLWRSQEKKKDCF